MDAREALANTRRQFPDEKLTLALAFYADMRGFAWATKGGEIFAFDPNVLFTGEAKTVNLRMYGA